MSRATLAPKRTLEIALRHIPAGARVLCIGSEAPQALAQARHVETLLVEGNELVAAVQERQGLDAVFCPHPSALAPLIPLMQSVHAALRPEGIAIVSDLVWQTAPAPELMKAFPPAPGRERIRPIEGYEMQVEHAGYDMMERADVPAEEWIHAFSDEPEKKAALAADGRGAAKLAIWALRRAP